MRVRMTGSADDATLRRALERAIGAEKVRTDDSILRTYSTDASPCAVEPRAVAFAETEDDVRAVLQVCREIEVPITPRASGTSLSGAAIGPGVVLDTTRFHRILDFDPERRLVRVEPGILLAELNAYLADRGMRFAPDPGSQELCRIGGMIGHNASGYRSVKYGQTRDHAGALKILLAAGAAVDAHDVPVAGAEWRGLGGGVGGAGAAGWGGGGRRGRGRTRGTGGRGGPRTAYGVGPCPVARGACGGHGSRAWADSGGARPITSPGRARGLLREAVASQAKPPVRVP